LCPLWELCSEHIITVLEAPLCDDKTIVTAEFTLECMLEGGQVGPTPLLVAAEAVKQSNKLSRLVQCEALFAAPLGEKANDPRAFGWVQANISADLACVTVGCVELVLAERDGDTWVGVA
jgi:hypothetical protein